MINAKPGRALEVVIEGATHTYYDCSPEYLAKWDTFRELSDLIENSRIAGYFNVPKDRWGDMHDYCEAVGSMVPVDSITTFLLALEEKDDTIILTLSDITVK